MPVEIRELVIKTTINTPKEGKQSSLDSKSLSTLKQQLVQECLKALRNKPQTNSFDR